MNGGRCSTTRIWRPPSSTASWSADGSFASMDHRDELVISSWRTPSQAVPNGSEYLEYVAQNFRDPTAVRGLRAGPPNNRATDLYLSYFLCIGTGRCNSSQRWSLIDQAQLIAQDSCSGSGVLGDPRSISDAKKHYLSALISPEENS